jgi:hypothetical protein
MIPKKCGCLEWKNFIQLNPSILFKKIMVGRKEKEGQVLVATKDLWFVAFLRSDSTKEIWFYFRVWGV